MARSDIRRIVAVGRMARSDIRRIAVVGRMARSDIRQNVQGTGSDKPSSSVVVQW
jgi:hypothetical protein